jgi:hypothetical protein
MSAAKLAPARDAAKRAAGREEEEDEGPIASGASELSASAGETETEEDEALADDEEINAVYGDLRSAWDRLLTEAHRVAEPGGDRLDQPRSPPQRPRPPPDAASAGAGAETARLRQRAEELGAALRDGSAPLSLHTYTSMQAEVDGALQWLEARLAHLARQGGDLPAEENAAVADEQAQARRALGDFEQLQRALRRELGESVQSTPARPRASADGEAEAAQSSPAPPAAPAAAAAASDASPLSIDARDLSSKEAVAAVAPARAAGALASPTREELETEIRGLRRQVTELQRRHHSDQARIASLERQVAQLEETILREAERTREEVKELQRSTREALEAKDGELAALRGVIDKLQVSLRDMLDISRRQGDLVAAAAAARPSGPHAFMVVQMLLLIAFVFVERLLRSGDASFTPS